ncbi:MAG: methyltransferase domain-containing protein [Flavobacteriaceae bacterium]|nr:methyltransferase domain-containing protein [Flavobacteriaceae bacterium]
MKEFWDDRYSEKEYAYGTEPNAYFKYALEKIHPSGAAFFPGEGEGRNAVYAAKQGLVVTALDYSSEARNKALKLAKHNNVTLEYQIGDMGHIRFKPNSFNLAVLVFTHFLPDESDNYFKALINYLKPGGYLIAELFSKDHSQFLKSNPLAGGPKNSDMLYTVSEIKKYFSGLAFIELEKKVIELNEGLYHRGQASVIRLIGQKI